jgi:hypothetical protein
MPRLDRTRRLAGPAHAGAVTDRLGLTPAPAECRSCHAAIVWAVTEAGRRMPLDVEPDPAGNLAIVEYLADGTPVVAFDAGARALLDLRYLSHFATCPQAGDWRRRG